MKSGSLIVMLLLGTAQTAAAADVKFCFKVYGDYSDAGAPLRNGLSEDYWADGAEAHFLRGAEYTIRDGSSTGTVLASGFLGDGIASGNPGLACSTLISLTNVNRTYWYHIGSEVQVNYNTIVGRRDDTGTKCGADILYSHVNGVGTHYLTIGGNSEECKDVFRALSAAAFSLYRHNGGINGQTINVRVKPPGQPGSSTSGSTVNVSDGGANAKFVVSHEMGHALKNTPVSRFTGDCSFNAGVLCPDDPDQPGQPTTSHHAMLSIEHSTCALNEAWAHFYAADTYNDHTQTDCAFNYYKPYFPASLGSTIVDCEGLSSDQSAIEGGSSPSWSLYPRAAFENVKPPNFSVPGCDTPWAGKSAEVDWLRVLWNMHTDGGGASFTEIMTWIDNANYSGQTCFSELNNEANAVGGILNTNWDANKGLHAVDN